MDVPVGKKIDCRSPLTYDFALAPVAARCVGVAVPALVETSTAIQRPRSLRYETRMSRRTSPESRSSPYQNCGSMASLKTTRIGDSIAVTVAIAEKRALDSAPAT